MSPKVRYRTKDLGHMERALDLLPYVCHEFKFLMLSMMGEAQLFDPNSSFACQPQVPQAISRESACKCGERSFPKG